MARTLFHDERRWTNYHSSVVDVPIAGRYELLNSSGTATLARMKAAAAATGRLIERAFRERRRLRPTGSAWSYSDAPSVAGGWVFDTDSANWIVRVPPTHVLPGFQGDRTGLFLLQTGVSVAEFNRVIERDYGRSLATSGASNGQTFVGAMSTGTHGSAIDQPAIQGQVRAIQLLTGPAENRWIEPAANPVLDGRLADALGATVERDDARFEAALVSLGGLGIVHAILVETVPIFLLETHRLKLPLDAGIERAMTAHDFSGLNVPTAPARPLFFQSVVNRHIDRAAAYVTVMVRRDWDPAHPLVYDTVNRQAPGYNLAVVVANLLQVAPGLTPPITKLVLADQLKPIKGRVASWGQSFNYNTPRAGTAGSSMAIPRERTLDALAAHERALKRVGQAPVAFACRYVRQSPGLLAFTRFPANVVMDTDGLASPQTRAVMAETVKEMRAAGIPFAEHPGKMNQLDAAGLRESLGSRVDRWLAVRRDLLDRDGDYCFGSAFLDRLGLSHDRW